MGYGMDAYGGIWRIPTADMDMVNGCLQSFVTLYRQATGMEERRRKASLGPNALGIL